MCRAVLPALAVGVLAAACGAAGRRRGGNDACDVTAQKEWVLATTRDWYYFDDLLPANVDLAQFPTAAELLDELTATARAQGKDRFFSFLTTRDEDSALLGEGEFIGFGLRTRTDPGPRVFVSRGLRAEPGERRPESSVVTRSSRSIRAAGSSQLPTCSPRATPSATCSVPRRSACSADCGLQIRPPRRARYR